MARLVVFNFSFEHTFFVSSIFMNPRHQKYMYLIIYFVSVACKSREDTKTTQALKVDDQ